LRRPPSDSLYRLLLRAYSQGRQLLARLPEDQPAWSARSLLHGQVRKSNETPRPIASFARLTSSSAGTIPTLVVPIMETTGSGMETRYRSFKDTMVRPARHPPPSLPNQRLISSFFSRGCLVNSFLPGLLPYFLQREPLPSRFRRRRLQRSRPNPLASNHRGQASRRHYHPCRSSLFSRPKLLAAGCEEWT
jgi:hypothetical protein